MFARILFSFSGRTFGLLFLELFFCSNFLKKKRDMLLFQLGGLLVLQQCASVRPRDLAWFCLRQGRTKDLVLEVARNVYF